MLSRHSMPARIRLHSPIIDDEEPQTSIPTFRSPVVQNLTPTHATHRRPVSTRATASSLLHAFNAKQSPTSISKQRKGVTISATPHTVKEQPKAIVSMENHRLRTRRSVAYAISDDSDSAGPSLESNFGSPGKALAADEEADSLDELQGEDEDEDNSSAPSELPTKDGPSLRPRRAASRKTIIYGIKKRVFKKKKSRQIIKKANIAAKTRTDRAQIRHEIQTITKAKQDEFLRTHKDLFLPLLPDNSYLHKLLDADSSDVSFEDYKELKDQPTGIVATMKPYQLSGLSFLVHLHNNGMAGILGDEMGLGKTLQTLALFQYLKENPTETTSLESRPFLVVCPLGVLSNWVAEARKFTPSLKVLRFHGSPSEKVHLKAAALGRRYTDRPGRTSKHKRPHHNDNLTPDVGSDDRPELIVTSWETYTSEASWFKTAFVWRYLVLDEGHKVKNSETNISKALQGLKSEYRLLLTGTPLQNDLTEMWSLLHWLLPDVFTDKTADIFKASFNLSKGQVNTHFMDHCRRLLEVLMLRRMKDSPGVDLNLPPKHEVRVFVPLTPVQRRLYTQLLTRETDPRLLEDVFRGAQEQEKDIMDVEGNESIEGSLEKVAPPKSLWMRLRNLVMQLRRCSTHPYLIPGQAPNPNIVGEHVILASGKFMALEKLITELVLKQGKKILVFSNFTEVLDWSEDLLSYISNYGSKFKHLRLDGSTSIARRNLAVRLFQDTGSDFKVMFISTRAGGLGINLTAATEAVFMDEDWNPQVDLQAEARCHRIGQTKPVTIYKLCSRGTVEEQMLGRIHKKLYLSTKITESMQTEYAHVSPKRKQAGKETLEEEKALFGDTSALKSLIRRGAQTLAHEEIDLEEMRSWDLDTFLAKCGNTSVDLDDEETHKPEEEEKWLATMEKVECAIFDGQRYNRSQKKEKSQDLGYGVQRKDRRIGKNVTVLHESGFMVNKQSLDCADWEAIPTIAGKDPRLAEVKRAKRAPIVSQEHCQVCYDGGSLILCTGCPRSYHAECLGEEGKAALNAWNWYCPQHKCHDCSRKPADVGGMVYSCRWCEKAYCEDCQDWDNTTLIADSLHELTALTFPRSNTSYYIECPNCKQAQIDQPELKLHLDEMATVYASAVKEIEAQKLDPKLNGTASERRESAAPSLTDAATTTTTTSGVMTPTDAHTFSPLGDYVSSKRKFANADGYALAEKLSYSAKKRRKTG